MKEPACCFAGHRPLKFHFGYDERHEDCGRLKTVLAEEIKRMLKQGITTFYSGMAMGTDLWAAQIVQALKPDFPSLSIMLIAVIPYEGQADRWRNDYQEQYFNVLAAADHAIVLHAQYKTGCIQERNQYMIDHSTHLIAVYNRSPGETKNTISYARSKNLALVTINPADMSIKKTLPTGNFLC